jgi:thioredoxin 1
MRVVNILLALMLVLVTPALSGDPIEIPKDGFVIINFYADWCADCLPTILFLDTLYEEYEDVMVIHVDVDQHYDLALDLGIKTLPFIVFIEDGNILGAIDGDVTFDLEEEIIREQLDKYRGK